MDLAKQNWLDALDDLIESEGADRVKEIFEVITTLNCSKRNSIIFHEYALCKYNSFRSTGTVPG